MGSTTRLFKIAGIPISIHVSWLAIYALITWTLAAGYFPQALPDRTAVTYWALGLVAALLLFASVLLHELSHSLVAVGHGLRVRGITLHIFGGVSQLEDEPPTPRAEALIAGVGPLTSFAIAGVLWALRELGVFAHPSVRAIADYLVTVNVMVGLFNLIPGFPLDGGRLLRALLWRWKGSLARATYLASRAGAAIAFALMAFGVFQMFGGSVISGVWLLLIGLFLQSAANTSSVQVGVREALERLPVRDIMTSTVIAVRPDETVAELVEEFWRHHVASFPVVGDGGRLLGIASVGQLQRVPREQWPVVRVADVMQPLDATLVVRPSDTAFRAFERASTNGLGRLAVMEGDRLIGYLSMQDITHVLALDGLGKQAAGRLAAPGTPRPPLRRVA